MNRILIMLLFFSILPSLHAQETEPFTIRYRIVDSVSTAPIALAHIYNESQRIGTISDTSGIFSMQVFPGDTLIFIALGYEGCVFIVKETEDNRIKQIPLIPRYYEIEEVRYRMPHNYTSFKKAFLETKTDTMDFFPEIPKHNPYVTPNLLDTNIIRNPAFIIFHPISGLYYNLSKEEKNKRKVWYLKQQELLEPEIEKKYNRELVTEITGLSGDDLTNFMGFCNFGFSFLYNSTRLEIVQAIDAKYSEYLTCCYDKEEHSRPAGDSESR